MVKDTVFSPSFGNRPSYFVGRETLMDRLIAGLENAPGSRDRAIVLLGQRGGGKTVLLRELADRAAEKGYVVATPTVAAGGMLERIVEKIQDSGERYAKERKTRMSGASVGALGFSAGLQFTREVQETKSFQYKLTQLARKLTGQGRGVLVLVDELQANSPDIRRLVIAYQELVGEGLDVALVMAGLPGAVSATLNDHVLTFLNRATKVELGPLRLGDVDAFFNDAFEQLGVSISTEIRKRAARATEGSPYLLQLVGHYLALYASPEAEVDDEVFNEAVAAARSDFMNDVCQTTLAALSDQDAAFLNAMAEDEGVSSISTVADRMGVTFDYAQKYRRRLIDAGIVETAGRGKVAFAVPLLPEYLKELRSRDE